MSSDEVENIGEAIIEDMGKGYRFRPFMQVVIVAVILFITALVLFIVPGGPPGTLDFKQPGDLTTATLAFCWVLSFLFPFIAKTRSHRVKQIAMGIFFAAIFALIGSIILLIADQAVAQSITIKPTSIALLIAFLVGVGAQLFEHLNPEAVKRTAILYFAIFAISVVFFICMWIYLAGIIGQWGIWIGIVFTALFAYALLPEKPK
ncbi:MAG: hypothetical protein HWN66_19355 [Candidatus Helarchaeota archaeon]|nr:hypothetical protein [Candidatus Helarchaeota archaeon]